MSDDRTVQLLTFDNMAEPGRRLVDDVIADEAPFFVDVRSDVLAVDFDGSRAEIQADLRFWWLRLNGLSPVKVASGQPGRRHVFCKIAYRGLKKRAVCFAKRLGGDVRRHIRPPLTPHRMTGSPDIEVRLLDPSDPWEALGRLTTPPTRRRVSEAHLDFVLDGRRGTGDKSRDLYRCAVGLVNAGWSLEECVQLLHVDATYVGRIFAERTRATGRDQLRWFVDFVWPQAVAFVEDNPPERKVPEDLYAHFGFALDSPWPGRAGSSDAPSTSRSSPLGTSPAGSRSSPASETLPMLRG